MTFLLDENVDLRVGRHLQSLGHDVTSIIRDYARQLPDTDVLAIAHHEQRTLITRDGDFERLVFTELRAHAGVIYLQLHNPPLASLIARVEVLLASHG
jgi:predicted nuclease of predicted toxin-antitoxin system